MTSKSLTKQTLLQGALILTIAAVIVRLLGAIYRIPLGRMLGDEGIGIYGIPNQIYYLFFTISSAGIPIGVARLISFKMAKGLYKDAYRTFKVALYAMLLAGLFFSLVLFFGANWLIEIGLVKNPNSLMGIQAIAPVVFFAAIVSAFRGLFQGMQNMSAVAISQIADQTMLVTGTLLFSYLLLPYGLAYGAAGANFGAVPGSIAATLIMLYFYQKNKPQILALVAKDTSKEQEKSWSLLKKILAISVPISFASIAMALTNLLDNVLIIDRLQLIGYSLEQATALYGQLTQFAMSFINFSIAFSLSMGTSLVPFVAEHYSLKNYTVIKNKIGQSLRLSIITSMPAAAGLLALAPHLTLLIYKNEPAGIPLAFITPAILFWGVNLVLSGTLQGMGKSLIPVINLLIGLSVKIILTYFLTPTFLEIRAAAIGTSSMFIIASTLNILSIRRLIGFSFKIKQGILKPLISSLIMGLGVWEVYNLSYTLLESNTISTIYGILSGIIIYPLVIIILGGLPSEDARHIPKIGNKLAKILETYEQKKKSFFNK